MRGCLVTLAVVLGLGLAGAWFGLPPLLGTVGEGALAAAGLHGTNTTVEVVADPPLKLLGLHADQVRIRSTNASFRGVNAASLDVTMDAVALVDRTWTGLHGTLKGVRVVSSGGRSVGIPLVELSSSGGEIRATMTLAAPDVEAAVTAAVEAGVGITPSAVVLSAPDRVQVDLGGQRIAGRLAVRDDGALLLVPPEGAALQPVTLLSPGPDVAFRVRSFRVVGGGLTVVAAIGAGSG